MRLNRIRQLLEPHRLLVLGHSGGASTYRVLVGNAGSEFWPVFAGSPEFSDGAADPLDRWSRRVGLGVAAAVGARVVFPFEGPPYPPFQEWAAESGQVVFKVRPDANKTEIKQAVELLFEVSVEDVNVLNYAGKIKRHGMSSGRRSAWKKAYVRLQEGQVIDVLGGEAP